MSEHEQICISANKVYDWITRKARRDFQFDSNSIDFFTTAFPPTGEAAVNPSIFFGEEALIEVDCNILDVECSEIGQREDIFIKESKSFLQLVRVRKTGSFQIILFSDDVPGQLFSEPISFGICEKVILCAPEGIEVICEISDIFCEGCFIVNATDFSLDVTLFLCQSIRAELDTPLEVKAKICKPRKEIAAFDRNCEEIEPPKQCPRLFPSSHKHKKVTDVGNS